MACWGHNILENSKLLGDCKPGNIIKELKKLKKEDNSDLKTHIMHLKAWLTDVQGTMKVQDKEIWKL